MFSFPPPPRLNASNADTQDQARSEPPSTAYSKSMIFKTSPDGRRFVPFAVSASYEKIPILELVGKTAASLAIR